MENRLRHKGRFIKKKVLDEKMKIVNSLRKNKEANNIERVKSNLIEGPRIVELAESGKNLSCCQCNDILCLENIVDKTRSGLNSILKSLRAHAADVWNPVIKNCNVIIFHETWLREDEQI
ncbi:hypothetical protein PV326_012550, partial [Microctonus aethiopoides]